MKLALLFFALLTAPAIAESAQPQTASSPQTLTITLPIEQWVGIVRSVENSSVISAQEAKADIAEINRQYVAAQPKQQKK